MLTNLFVHADFGHILCNMISLYFLGSFLLRLVGERKFLITYFLGGIVGNILFILLASPFSTGVGASGAIFALGGALVMIAPGLRVFIIPIPIPVPLWVAMVIFLLISFVGAGIAWQAHLGGFILGLVAGYFLRRRRRTSYF
jgi:membrane associated rhomboid family serine protease